MFNLYHNPNPYHLYSTHLPSSYQNHDAYVRTLEEERARALAKERARAAAQQRASRYFPGGYEYPTSDEDEDEYGGFGLNPRGRAYLEAKRRQEVVEKRRREEQEIRSRLIDEERKRRAERAEEERRQRERMRRSSSKESGVASPQTRPVRSGSGSPPRATSNPARSNMSRSPSPSKTTAPLPTETTTPTGSFPDQDEAATKIQSLYRAHRSIRTIKAIESQFEALRAAFVFPSIIDFQDLEGGVISISASQFTASPPEDTSSQGQPRAKLAYSAANVPLHTYIESLNRLLVALDGVESWGVKYVRERRKGVVGMVEKEAEHVDELWRRIWAKNANKSQEQEKRDNVDLELTAGTDEEQGEREEQEVVAMVVDALEETRRISNAEMHVESAANASNDDKPVEISEWTSDDHNSISPSPRGPPSAPDSSYSNADLSPLANLNTDSVDSAPIVDIDTSDSDIDTVSDSELEPLTPVENPEPAISVIEHTSTDIGVGSEEGKEDSENDVAFTGSEKGPLGADSMDLSEDFVVL